MASYLFLDGSACCRANSIQGWGYKGKANEKHENLCNNKKSSLSNKKRNKKGTLQSKRKLNEYKSEAELFVI